MTNRSKSKAVMPAAPGSFSAPPQAPRPVVLGLEDHDAIRPGDNGRIRDAEKQTVLDHAGNEFQRLVQRLGIVDPAKGTVEDVIAAIGDERLPVGPQPEPDLAPAARVSPQ